MHKGPLLILSLPDFWNKTESAFLDNIMKLNSLEFFKHEF